jgi:hypothetical protein
LYSTTGDLKNMTMQQALGNIGLKDSTAYSPPYRTLNYSPPEKRFVTEAEYWEKYYDYPDKVYEWHNGYLEEKSMSEQVTYSTFLWYLKLVDYYLETHQSADLAGLEMAFRLVLPNAISIRKPDLGIVLKSNPVPLLPHDSSYDGIFDICVEALSESTAEMLKRDTVIKKAEYAQAGVKEYIILDGNKRYSQFYRLDKNGLYAPVKPLKGGIIKSKELPGFQFRIDDLYQKPSPDEMVKDKVYKGFVLPGYSEALQQAVDALQKSVVEERARKEAEQRAEHAEQNAKQAQKEAQKERQRAEQRAEQLRALGIEPD